MLSTLKTSTMPPSPSEPEQAEQAKPTGSFTLEELMSLQVVAQLLKINFSEMIRCAEIQQQNPDAPFPLFNHQVAKPVSLFLSQNLKTEPTTASVSYDVAKESTRHTFEEQGNGGCAVIKPEAFDSAAAGFVGEQHQANLIEGKHGLTVIDPVLGLSWQQIKPNLSSRHGKYLISAKF